MPASSLVWVQHHAPTTRTHVLILQLLHKLQHPFHQRWEKLPRADCTGVLPTKAAGLGFCSSTFLSSHLACSMKREREHLIMERYTWEEAPVWGDTDIWENGDSCLRTDSGLSMKTPFWGDSDSYHRLRSEDKGSCLSMEIPVWEGSDSCLRIWKLLTEVRDPRGQALQSDVCDSGLRWQWLLLYFTCMSKNKARKKIK